MYSSLFDALTADEISTVASVVRGAGIGGERPGFGSVGR